MARRKAKAKRRRSTGIKILNVLESYTYASILSQGLAGNSPIGLITGDTDLGIVETSGYSFGLPVTGTRVVGAQSLSLGDIISEPQLALNRMRSNFENNWASMAIQTTLTRFTFKFGKKLLSAPIANVNRNIMKPLLGAGIKL